MANQSYKAWPKWRTNLHDIIFEADTKPGKTFDITLLILIILSVVAVMLDSVESLYSKYHLEFLRVEWILTILFTIEYVARLVSVRKPWKYVISFYGVIDLLSILPSYLSIFFDGSGQSFAVIRALRLLRVFRVLKLARYTQEAGQITRALIASRYKIFIFMFFVLTIVIIIGSMMYLVEGMYVVEGSENDFENIPMSIYWAIVTLTTVGYGDIVPETPLGRFLASWMLTIVDLVERS